MDGEPTETSALAALVTAPDGAWQQLAPQRWGLALRGGSVVLVMEPSNGGFLTRATLNGYCAGAQWTDAPDVAAAQQGAAAFGQAITAIAAAVERDVAAAPGVLS